MQSFPMFIKTTGRRVIVAGGGEQAAQKCRLLLKTDAEITVLSQTLDDELAALAAAGKIAHDATPVGRHSFAGAAMGFIATGSPVADVCLHDIAKCAGLLVNVVDRPALCDITTPSIVDRDPVVIAIGTEGTAPVLARRIKSQLEQSLDPQLGPFAAAAGRLRDMVARHVPREQRRQFWREVFTGDIWRRFRAGAEREALLALKARIRNGAAGAPFGTITVIDTDVGAADLLPVRAVERLQEADEIFYESEADAAILELARRDAERHLLAGANGAQPWPLRMCITFVKRAASNGRAIVWLRKKAAEDAALSHALGENSGDIAVEILTAAGSKTAMNQAIFSKVTSDI
ncbi:NAD(P)-dependent oxidoreductase [Cognatishimia sp. SS12]|uniref:siroheme synthase n=1 Tax=Cognatishimia sp. SS12 TaxID=2979465 RepID=UPI0023312E8B|nr:NAD(P)-dependent oxidoreductase [Cognatishimia sp. SS12]MDC0738806.1 NAD(P)-dependent oxidoreductase [Cognatishimia sp. SS12]